MNGGNVAMTEKYLDNYSTLELIKASKQLDEQIATLQAELGHTPPGPNNAHDPMHYYIILGPYTHEPYEVEPLGPTPRGRQVFKIDAPEISTCSQSTHSSDLAVVS